MTFKAHHLLAYVAAISEIRNLLSHSCMIKLDQLSFAVKQLADALLQSFAIYFRETTGCRFNHGNKRLNFIEPFAHLIVERYPFLFAHSFQLGERFIERTFDPFDHRLVESVASRLQRAGQASHNVDINFTGDLKFLLHLTEGTDITGDQRPIQLISNLGGAFKSNGSVNTASRKARADAFLDHWFQCRKLATDSQVNIQKSIVNSLKIDRG